jgi:hypothetical protein
MKRVYDAPIMRPDTLNGQEKLKFTIIGAWTDKQKQNFVHALFISFKRSSPLKPHPSSAAKDQRSARTRPSTNKRIERKKDMKINVLLANLAFRNGKDSLKITWVSAWQGAEVFHAQTFPERCRCKRVRKNGQRQFPCLKAPWESARLGKKETKVIRQSLNLKVTAQPSW